MVGRFCLVPKVPTVEFGNWLWHFERCTNNNCVANAGLNV